MAYKVKARYYDQPDQFGESYVITSDNGNKDMRIEPGRKVLIVPLCRCGKVATVVNSFCEKCGEEAANY